MDIEAILFDVNGTLIEIWPEDGMDEIFRAAGHYLTYQGVDLRRYEVRDLYFKYLKEQQKSSQESHPEFDAVKIWKRIVDEFATDFTRSLPQEKLDQVPLFLAELYRGISRRRLRLYPYVIEVLDLVRRQRETENPHRERRRIGVAGRRHGGRRCAAFSLPPHRPIGGRPGGRPSRPGRQRR